MKSLLKRFAGFLPLAGLALASSAQAGIFSVVTYPVRHPVKSTKKVFAVATYPVRHPVKTVK
jgi:hypothetical protein